MEPPRVAEPTNVLLRELVDDAGLFPPEELTMSAALLRHRKDRREAHPELSGRFVCPLSRLEELQGELGEADRIALALIVSPLDDGVMAEAQRVVAADRRLELSCLEGPLLDGVLPVRAPGAVPAYVEITPTADWPTVAGELGERQLGAKLRCGGLTPELFPTPAQLATAIVACCEAGVFFKATAGLHHAVRHRDERTGFVHHGFLNLLLAAARAREGGGHAAVADVLSCEDPGALTNEALGLSLEQAERARFLFRSYGSCSTSEPLDDLASLGLRGDRARV